MVTQLVKSTLEYAKDVFNGKSANVDSNNDLEMDMALKDDSLVGAKVSINDILNERDKVRKELDEETPSLKFFVISKRTNSDVLTLTPTDLIKDKPTYFTNMIKDIYMTGIDKGVTHKAIHAIASSVYRNLVGKIC